jgi:hypothetical protein
VITWPTGTGARGALDPRVGAAVVDVLVHVVVLNLLIEYRRRGVDTHPPAAAAAS